MGLYNIFSMSTLLRSLGRILGSLIAVSCITVIIMGTILWETPHIAEMLVRLHSGSPGPLGEMLFGSFF